MEQRAQRVLFIPYAAVTYRYDEYEQRVAGAFNPLGFEVRSIHHEPDPISAVCNAQAIVVGGGNTFALLTRLYENGLVDVVRDRVLAGVPYVGWSAGSNVACPTIRTTNDMPIVAPPSLNAMALVPFQINPHFVSGKLPGHHVHSREERLAEFLAFNQNEQLVALPEGTAILRRENRALVMGQHDAVWFRQGGKVASLRTGTEFELTEIMSS